jgi:hypothetical protein
MKYFSRCIRRRTAPTGPRTSVRCVEISSGKPSFVRRLPHGVFSRSLSIIAHFREFKTRRRGKCELFHCIIVFIPVENHPRIFRGQWLYRR